MVSGNFQLVEDPVRFPPPVVFGLSEFSLPVVSIQIRVICVSASDYLSLLYGDIPGAVTLGLSGESIRVGLYGERVEDLHDPGEVDALDEVVRLGIVVVVREHYQRRFYVPRLSKTYYEVAEVDDSCVHLNDDDQGVILNGAEDVLIVNRLLEVVLVNVSEDLGYREAWDAPSAVPGRSVESMAHVPRLRRKELVQYLWDHAEDDGGVVGGL